MKNKGFTLLELMLAIAILTVVTAIVFTSFASVTRSIDMSRVGAEELRLRQYIERTMRDNFEAVFVDEAYSNNVLAFVGVNEDSMEGPQDAVQFATKAPMQGGLSLPGDVKIVTYQVLRASNSGFSIDENEDKEMLEALYGKEPDRLRVTEVPVMASGLTSQEMQDMLASNSVDSMSMSSSFGADEEEVEQAKWVVPIRTVSFEYFDGTDWVEEWNSLETGRLPWCVRIRVNFAKTKQQLEEEEDAHYDIEEDPDFEMILPIPTGMGIMDDQRMMARGANGADGAAGALGDLLEDNPNFSGDQLNQLLQGVDPSVIQNFLQNMDPAQIQQYLQNIDPAQLQQLIQSYSNMQGGGARQ